MAGETLINTATEQTLRRLRFPDDTERSFRIDYCQRSLGHIRFVFLLSCFLFEDRIAGSPERREREPAATA
jgi:hypothetical protein